MIVSASIPVDFARFTISGGVTSISIIRCGFLRLRYFRRYLLSGVPMCRPARLIISRKLKRNHSELPTQIGIQRATIQAFEQQLDCGGHRDCILHGVFHFDAVDGLSHTKMSPRAAFTERRATIGTC
jgi:hypothetical protein